MNGNHTIMAKTTIGKTIKARRKELRLLQPDLAGIAGISINTLYKIERDAANPTLNVLQRIADTLGMELGLTVKISNK